MGSIVSKSSQKKDVHQLAETPTKLTDNCSKYDDDELMDPRSPNVCRTPISCSSSVAGQFQITKSKNLTKDENISMNQTPINPLKTKLLRDLGYSNALLIDPRSPNLQMHRTPITFSDEQKPTLNYEIEPNSLSFADNSTSQIFLDVSDTSLHNSISSSSNTTFEECSLLDENIAPKYLETELNAAVMGKLKILSEIDPRSPSINVERTPIVFATAKPLLKIDSIEQLTNLPNDDDCGLPAEEPAEPKESKGFIYEDNNEELETVCTTPTMTKLSNPLITIQNAGGNNRTPLSCLGNARNGGRLNSQQTTKDKPMNNKASFFNSNQSTPLKPTFAQANQQIINSNKNSSKIPVFKK